MGKKWTDEQRANLRAKMNTPEVIEKIRGKLKGRTMTDEQKQRIRDGLKASYARKKAGGGDTNGTAEQAVDAPAEEAVAVADSGETATSSKKRKFFE